MSIAQQFICNKCATLSNVRTFEKSKEGQYFCRCEACGAKNKVVHTGASASRPGILPVTGLLD
jgi:transcription elongation factor Elf1